jgi:hypothetical protein
MPESVCPSCLESKECEHEWHPEVPRPGHIIDDPICDDCHASLRRVAGQDENPLTGVAPPHPASMEAREGLLRMSARGAVL